MGNRSYRMKVSQRTTVQIICNKIFQKYFFCLKAQKYQQDITVNSITSRKYDLLEFIDQKTSRENEYHKGLFNKSTTVRVLVLIGC